MNKKHEYRYPDMVEPEVGENQDYYDWGTMLPGETEVLIDSGNGWEVYKRGNFEGYSIVFPLASRGIHPPEWSSRIVEAYPDHAVEIIPEEKTGDRMMTTRKLEDGTYLYTVSGVGVWQVDRNGSTINKYLGKGTSHESTMLRNGHILMCSPNPPNGGFAQEIDWDGKVYWKFDQNDYGLPYSEQNIKLYDQHFENPMYVIHEYDNFSHIALNAVQALPGGHHLISFRNANLVIELDENDKVIWSFGPMVIKHQHCPHVLDNGNVLIHDTYNYRAIEVTRSHEIVWEFNKGMVCPYLGTVQRLSDGNTVMTDGFRAVAFCVSPHGEVLWEVYVKGKNTLPRTKVLEYVKSVKAVFSNVGLPGFRIYRAWAYPMG